MVIIIHTLKIRIFEIKKKTREINIIACLLGITQNQNEADKARV